MKEGEAVSEEISSEVLLKIIRSLNMSNLIPTFEDLLKAMNDQSAIEAKHFDVPVRFIKDIERFISSNKATLIRGNMESSLNMRKSQNPELNKKSIAKKPSQKYISSNTFFQ